MCVFSGVFDSLAKNQITDAMAVKIAEALPSTTLTVGVRAVAATPRALCDLGVRAGVCVCLGGRC